MKGKHHIIIETDNLKYEFDIRRNITVIQGESATGKTTLVDLIAEYVRGGRGRGIRFSSDVPCGVYTGHEAHWKQELELLSGSIVFIDEDYRFMYTREFAEYLSTADQYFVLITRKALKSLPYSVKEIYGIRTVGKYHFPEQVYHEFYPIFDNALLNGKAEAEAKLMLMIEDKRSGYQFFDKVLADTQVISSEGNASVYVKMIEAPDDHRLLVIADGAAFGAYVENVVKYAERKGNIGLYFPESFEWMILRSGVISDKEIAEILENPEDYIDSRQYSSWERFFTALLKEKTADDLYKKYEKEKLSDFYTSTKNSNMILQAMPEEIRELLR